MRPADYLTIVCLLLLTFAIVFFGRSLSDALIEALNNFRGGPRPPTHPLPASDGALLRKRAKKAKVWHL